MKLILWSVTENEGSEIEEDVVNNPTIVTTNVKVEIYEDIYHE